ncbi:uncharacterized protein LOC135370192 [Ornithodoros turicata]|uniref:uncharacterized protein LOC135370192 n=1 Tax=Ornithodoros turicata TaxID=34597 RepID=UPI0031398973
MEIVAHALNELNSGRHRFPAFCSKFKVSFSAGSQDNSIGTSRRTRDPSVRIENVMEEVSDRKKDAELHRVGEQAVGDCLRSAVISSSRNKSTSLVLNTARRFYRKSNPYVACAAEGQDNILTKNRIVSKSSLERRHKGDSLEDPIPEPDSTRHGAPEGTSGSAESLSSSEFSAVPQRCSHRDYVLQVQAIFETYWKGNLKNIFEVLRELSERASGELSWKKQSKLQEFTKGVTRLWHRVGEQVSSSTNDILCGLESNKSNEEPNSDFFAHELLPLLLRIREVWWVTQRHIAGNFLSLYQKYDDVPEQWLMAMREVDVHLLRTAIVHREIMECELQKVARAIEQDNEVSGEAVCYLQDIFIKEGIGYWLAEHLDLIWSEFGNQVQKGVVNLYKAFDSSYIRAWAAKSRLDQNEVLHTIHSYWMSFIQGVQECRRDVVDEETSKNNKDELTYDLDNNSIPHRIYIYTRILRRYEDLVNHDWQVTYRNTIALLDQALALEKEQEVVFPVIHTKATVIITKIWEEVMVEIRQTFRECREKFEEAILTDRVG